MAQEASATFTRPPPYQSISLQGEVALITGASAGFGVSIAWRLAELGAKLILVARRRERLQALSDALRDAFGTQTHIVVQDVRECEKLATLVDQLPPEFQQVDILINNAGLALGVAQAAENDLEDMRTMLETNVLAVMALTKACLKGMMARNKGHIINICSTAGHESYPGGSGYCASKFALRAYTDTCRHELVGTDIRISLVSPGAVETEFSLVRFKGDTDRAAKVYEGMAKMSAEDIADHVTYVLTRPRHVQIADLITMSVHQSGAKYIVRPLQQQ